MDNLMMQKRLVLFEIIGSVLWYFMDASWVLTELPDPPPDSGWFVRTMFVLIVAIKPVAWAKVAKALILPTLALNLFTLYYTERTFSQMAVTFAMNCWLWMNTFWMLAGLDKQPALFAYSVFFGLLGMLTLAAASWKTIDDREPLTAILVRFRRFRLHIGTKVGK